MLIERRRHPFTTGGHVKLVKGRLTKYAKTHDTIPALLQVGELVIPKPYVKPVEKFLRANKMPLPLPRRKK